MSTQITMHDMILRLALSLVAGLMVGFERESHGRAAGFRTTTLVCVASAMAMMLSEYLFSVSTGGSVLAGWRPDPARLAAGILTGIGFLGAGTIIRQDNLVRGVTTAAVLWFVTVLGLTIGSGYLLLAGMGLGVALVVLFVLPLLEVYIKNDWYATVSVTTQMDGIADREIRRLVEECGVSVKNVGFDYDMQSNQKTLRCEVKFKKTDLFRTAEGVIQHVRKSPGVMQVKWS